MLEHKGMSGVDFLLTVCVCVALGSKCMGITMWGKTRR